MATRFTKQVLKLGMSFFLVPAVVAAPPVAYDWIITTPADFASATFTTYKTTGGLVGVAPGVYGSQTITATPSAPLVIEGTDPLNPPVFDQMIVGNLGDVKLRNMLVLSSRWDASASFSAVSNPCMTMGTGGGTAVISGEVEFDNITFRGNYRGDTNAYFTFDDTTHNIPEYAVIHGIVTGGVFTSLALAQSPAGTFTSNYVGDLVPDGTNYPITVKAPVTGSGFEAYFDVVGGYITNLNLVNGGSGYTFAAGATSPYNLLTFTGSRPMARWLPRGISGKMSIPVGGKFTMKNCNFQLVSSMFKPAFATGTSTDWIETFNVSGDLIYLDGIAMTIRTQPAHAYHKFDKFFRFFCCSGDAEDPHGDGLQGIMVPSTGNWVPDVYCIGIEALTPPSCRGNAGQFIFMADANGHAYQLHAVGCCGMFQSSNGLIADVASNCFVYGNTVLPGHPSKGGHDSAIRILLSNSASAYGQSIMEANIAEGLGTGAAASSNVTLRNNYSTGLLTSPTPDYSAVFPDSSSPTTIAEMRVKRKAIGIHADKGAYRDPLWIDHAAMTYDPTREPSFIRFPTVIDQPLSGFATSGWAKLIGGPDLQTVSISNGTFETATDVSFGGVATGVVSGLTSATLARGTWIRTIVPTSALGSTATQAILTVRGTYTFTFSDVTLLSSSLTVADNQAAAWSQCNTLPTFTGAQGLIFAMRFRMDAYATNKTLFGNGNGANLVTLWAGNQWRSTIKNSSTAPRWTMTQAAGQMVTMVQAYDFTKTTKEEGARCFVNGNPLGHATSNSNFPSSGTTTISSSDIWATPDLGILAKGDGTDIIDGAGEWFWFDHYASAASMPDIGDPVVLADFSADKFLVSGDGSTPLLPQPALFWGGASSLSLWNGTFPNAGRTAGADLIRQGATSYV